MQSQDFKTLGDIFSVFGGKRPITVNFSKLCSESFPRDTDREIGEIVRCIPDKKAIFRLSDQLCLPRESHPKISQGQPRQCSQSVPDFIQISGSLTRSYSRTREHRQNTP